jgi:hypothetical protein
MSVGVVRPVHGHHPALWVPGVPRPDLGDGMVQLVCDECSAGWVGLPGEPCGWCADRTERQREDQRRMLLWPDRLGEHGPRYDELGEVDQAVWDRTRGIARGHDSRRAWAERLGRAVHAGLITEREAKAAMERVRRGDARRAG